MSNTHVVEVDEALLARTLDCYFPHVRYLKNAQVEYTDGGNSFPSEIGPCVAIGRGSFAAPPAWYIQSTGHFNAIEFNLAYNQLAYVLLAQCVDSQALPLLSAHVPKGEFHSRMLGDILILKYSVAFHKAMDASTFQARLIVQKTMERGGLVFLKTHCRVSANVDDAHHASWSSRGDVLLAVVQSEATTAKATDQVRRAPDPKFGYAPSGA